MELRVTAAEAIMPRAAAAGEVGQVMLMIGLRKLPCPMSTGEEAGGGDRRGMVTVMGAERSAPASAPPTTDTVSTRESKGRPGSRSLTCVARGPVTARSSPALACRPVMPSIKPRLPPLVLSGAPDSASGAGYSSAPNPSVSITGEKPL